MGDWKLSRFQNWEAEPWTWGRFQRLPNDFQIFAAIGGLGPVAVVLLAVMAPRL
jgi:hypothetical protein